MVKNSQAVLQVHGGDVEEVKDLYDGEIIDFSSNINPLGPPDGLDGYLKDNFKKVKCYPDINYKAAKKHVSKYLKCSPDEVVLGNGAVEIINNFILLFKRVVVLTPCFYEYIKRAKVLKKEIVELHRDENFKIDILMLDGALKEGDILILGNPNNPDGGIIEKSDLVKIINICSERGVFLLLDEAFYEFSDMDYDSIQILKDNKFEYACVIRAATKFFALPGIRLGYGWTDIRNSKVYKEIELSWSINTFAALSAEFIFNDDNYVKKSRSTMAAQRNFLLQQLSEISYLKAYTSHAAFILIKLFKHDEDFFFDYFLKKGILLRKASNFKGLDRSYIRIAVKNRRQNEKLLDIFKELDK